MPDLNKFCCEKGEAYKAGFTIIWKSMYAIYVLRLFFYSDVTNAEGRCFAHARTYTIYIMQTLMCCGCLK